MKALKRIPNLKTRIPGNICCEDIKACAVTTMKQEPTFGPGSQLLVSIRIPHAVLEVRTLLQNNQTKEEKTCELQYMRQTCESCVNNNICMWARSAYIGTNLVGGEVEPRVGVSLLRRAAEPRSGQLRVCERRAECTETGVSAWNKLRYLVVVHPPEFHSFPINITFITQIAQ